MGQATICTLLRPNSTHKRIFTKSVRMYDYVRIRRTNTIVPTMFSRQDEDREDVFHARGAHTESTYVITNQPKLMHVPAPTPS